MSPFRDIIHDNISDVSSLIATNLTAGMFEPRTLSHRVVHINMGGYLSQWSMDGVNIKHTDKGQLLLLLEWQMGVL
jgi:hypothetical protein